MRKGLWISGISVLAGAASLMALYSVSSYGRHDRQAAALETLLSEIVATEDAHVISGEHEVFTVSQGGAGCWYGVTIDVTTPQTKSELQANIKQHLIVYPDTFLRVQVSSLGFLDRQHLLRVHTESLGEGGTLDLRCG